MGICRSSVSRERSEPETSPSTAASNTTPPMRSKPIPVTATHVKDLYAKGSINGSALMSTNKLLVIDWDNKKARLVDTSSGRRVSKLELPYKPHQVAKISDTEAAITIPAKHEIVLVRTHPKLSVVRKIDVQGDCFGIAYMDGKLIVTILGDDSRVDILDMSGKVLQTIATKQESGTEIFSQATHITVDAATGSMYLSDWVRFGTQNRIVKLSSKEGTVEATYGCDERGGLPRQSALDRQSGSIYVVWKGESGKPGDPGWVDQLSAANCDWVRTIIAEPSPQPQALSYDEATQQLYIGDEYGAVKVYKLSHDSC